MTLLPLVFCNLNSYFSSQSKLGKAYMSGQQQVLDQLLAEVSQKRFDNFRRYLQQKNVQRLDLSKRNLGTKNLGLLSKALAGTDVSAIDLSHNEIDDKGLAAFAKNLPSTNLRVVNLDDNDISDKGALFFAKKIKKSKVVSWFISYNAITMEGASNIAKALAGSSLTFLDLSCTLINKENENASVFIRNLQGSSVSKIALQFNELTDERMWEIIDNIPKTNLIKIDVSFNKEISSEMHQRLKQALSTNERRLLMQCYPLWALNKIKDNKPGGSNLSQEALKTPEDKFKYAAEILASASLPRELRDLIIEKVYPCYTSKVGKAFTHIFDEKRKKRPATTNSLAAIPKTTEVRKKIYPHRTGAL